MKKKIEEGEPKKRGKDEMNLAEFPISTLEKKRGVQKTITFSDKVYDSSTGKTSERHVTVSPSAHYGLPTASDEEVLLGLVQMAAKQNFESITFYVSFVELLRMLKWENSGKSYKILKESLLRWLGVTIAYEYSWWDKENQKWRTEGFHILDNVSLDSNKKHKKNELDAIEVTWNKVIFQSFQAGNLKYLDFDFFVALATPIAKRMYRYLDKKFHKTNFYESKLETFAFSHIGLSDNCPITDVKLRLKKAIKELEDKGFLEKASESERFFKASNGVWMVRFVRAKTQVEAKSLPVAAVKPRQKKQKPHSEDDLMTLYRAWQKMGTQPEKFPGGIEEFKRIAILADSCPAEAV